ncbi:gas vesicle protein GvpA/GvpJ/GvpM family [Murinocardiopsis flavida]|uniref:Gas vesicle protein GvpA/GvpJ/GvpM family n=1 Tax=Murinocardiopsis flavida TaxID=645275 RepID=A0A2P8DL90_9ACTN|nr:gas vesicle protein GvpA/GvpJ/GvpM family [Murinocardiopsis flavida]
MTEPTPWRGEPREIRSRGGNGSSANLADVLERVLDKGVVIAGDIKINLLDIELLTIKLRLLVASVDKAKEMGIDWWEQDPALSSSAMSRGDEELADENRALRERIAALEERDSPALEQGAGDASGSTEDASGTAEAPAAKSRPAKSGASKSGTAAQTRGDGSGGSIGDAANKSGVAKSGTAARSRGGAKRKDGE